jgi:regulator of sigma E protease
MLGVLEDVLWLLVLIGVMINIHELGHFWAARFFDVKVEAFSFGFGPRLFGFRRGETDYRFSLLPIGGYVKMAGELAGDGNPNSGWVENTPSDPRALTSKPRWQRLIIAFAGPFMNMVLAVAVLTGMYMVKFQKVADSDLKAVIGHVMPDSPAAKAGIEDGDRIVGLDGKPNPTWEDIGLKEVTSAYRPMHLEVDRDGKRFATTVIPTLNDRIGVGFAGWDERGQIQLGQVEPGYPADKAGLKKGDLLMSVNGQPIHSQIKFQEITKSSGGKPIDITYQRNGQMHDVSVQPVFAKIDGPARWMIGVVPQQKLNLITTRLSFPEALTESVRQNEKGAVLMFEFLKGVVQRRMSTRNLAGPIGIAQLSGDAAREGAGVFFMLMATVSLQLAIINLMPIPIMDGGVILMLLIEMVMRRDMSLNVKEAVFKLGFVTIVVILAFAIYNDISKIIPG